MELSQFTDYALRTLMFVGLRGGEPTQIRLVANTYGISTHHVVKVAHRLGQLGYLHTQRGRGGGLRLARAASEIGIGDVVRDTERLALVECMPPRTGTCKIAGPCQLKRALARATDAFLQTLDEYTLEDFLLPGAQLRDVLAL